MSDALSGLFGNVLGRATAPIGAIAVALEAMGSVTEFTGEEIDALGELQQQLADMIQAARARMQGDEAG